MAPEPKLRFFAPPPHSYLILPCFSLKLDYRPLLTLFDPLSSTFGYASALRMSFCTKNTKSAILGDRPRGFQVTPRWLNQPSQVRYKAQQSVVEM